jgi:hypothetical protein
MTRTYSTRSLAVFFALVAVLWGSAMSASAAAVANRAPIINDDTYSTNVGGTITTVLVDGALSNDTDDDGDALTATLGTTSFADASTTLAFNADGSFTYMAAPGFSGVDSFTYSASDGTLSGSATVYIVVSDTEAAPVTEDDAYTVNQGDVLTVGAPDGVLKNDNDPHGLPLTVSLENDVNDGTLALATDGSFMYTPDASFSGLESFTYKASNGAYYGSTRTAVITVVALPASSTPATTTPPVVTTPPTTGSSSGHHSSHHHSSSANDDEDGEVLGASTGPMCNGGVYLTKYLRIGRDNDPAEVMKLQSFLNTEMNADLAINGVFDATTYAMVNNFQLKYWQEVLSPWVPFGLPTDHSTTGYVYKTTTWEINKLACSNESLPMPQLP